MLVKLALHRVLLWKCTSIAWQEYDYIPGVPEKAERWIFSTLRAESVI